ncbi:hypothetical protein [Streptomyces sp. cg35]|uniref:hypothetical protein n=1 Tax=Streptomyces sp. cg35 TaxID=3421650 RepID=UPI003D17557D
MESAQNAAPNPVTAVNITSAGDTRDGVPPGGLVEQAVRLLQQAETLLEDAVIAERMRDTSWERIGLELGGVSKSAAHKRFAGVVSNFQDVLDGGRRDIRDAETGLDVMGHSNVRFLTAHQDVLNSWSTVREIVDDQAILADLHGAAVAVQRGGRTHKRPVQVADEGESSAPSVMLPDSGPDIVVTGDGGAQYVIELKATGEVTRARQSLKLGGGKKPRRLLHAEPGYLYVPVAPSGAPPSADAFEAAVGRALASLIGEPELDDTVHAARRMLSRLEAVEHRLDQIESRQPPDALPPDLDGSTPE